MPTGTVVPFASSSVPAGWLICGGQAVSRSTFAALFSTIGTTYGSGDGSTTFNVPDLRGRVVAGLDNMGGTDAGRLNWTNALGVNGGSQTHTLTIDEMPSHNHPWSTIVMDSPAGFGYPQRAGLNNNSNFVNPTGFTGGGQAHNIMQPTMVLNYIIKT